MSAKIGDWGEAAARNYLERKGFIFVGAGYTTRYGEIDLILRDGGTVVFAEVKLRKNRDFGEAREFITPAKQRRLRATAELWLNANAPDERARFDVVEVYAPDGVDTRSPEIVHIEDAF